MTFEQFNRVATLYVGDVVYLTKRFYTPEDNESFLEKCRVVKDKQLTLWKSENYYLEMSNKKRLYFDTANNRKYNIFFNREDAEIYNFINDCEYMESTDTLASMILEKADLVLKVI